jgi:hypothetical protein
MSDNRIARRRAKEAQARVFDRTCIQYTGAPPVVMLPHGFADYFDFNDPIPGAKLS